jgi:hypothetical protein
LYELFSKYGELNSIKVMWPRTDEEKARKRNCGFVSFMRRADAEDAKFDLQEHELEGACMSICWGKAVKLNSCPFVLPTNIQTSAPHVSIPPVPVTAAASSISTLLALKGQPPHPVGPPPTLSSHQYGNLQPAPPMLPPPRPPAPISFPPGLSHIPSAPSVPPPLPPMLPKMTPPPSEATSGRVNKWDARPEIVQNEMKPGDTRIEVTVPANSRRRQMIDLLAKFVSSDGEAFEKVWTHTSFEWR